MAHRGQTGQIFDGERRVNNHSATWNGWCKRVLIAGTLSAVTTAMLSRISAISAWSNRRPARVSASKMTV